MASFSITSASSIEDHDHAERSVEAMEIELSSLPPTDHGRDAYLVLAGCMLIQASVWGKQSKGIYQTFNS